RDRREYGRLHLRARRRPARPAICRSRLDHLDHDGGRRRRFLGVSRLNFLDWQSGARSLSRLGVLTGASLNVSEQGRPAEQYAGTYGSATLFEVSGQRPQLGRDSIAADDTPGAEPVVIISD